MDIMAALNAFATHLTQRIDDVGAPALRGDIAELSSRIDTLGASDGGLTLRRSQLKVIEDNAAANSSADDVLAAQTAIHDLGQHYDEMHHALIVTQQSVIRLTKRCSDMAKQPVSASAHDDGNESRQNIERLARVQAELQRTCEQVHGSQSPAISQIRESVARLQCKND